MKAVSKLVVMLSLGALGMVSAFASTSSEQTYIENCRKDPGVPVPVQVVTPDVGAEYSGSKVELEFVVDQKGLPESLTVKSATNSAVAAAVVDAVKQWKFRPAMHNGVPVATKVSLPVTIVEPAFGGPAFAAND